MIPERVTRTEYKGMVLPFGDHFYNTLLLQQLSLDPSES